MSETPKGPKVLSRVGSAALLLVAVALGTRLAWEVLKPLVPIALVLAFLAWLYVTFVGPGRRS